MKIKNAFTLVEMIIVIALVIALSVISVPVYTKYQKKAAYTEGYILIATIRDAQLAYRAQYGNFLNYAQSSGRGANVGWTCKEEVLGINARGNKYFTCFTVGMGSNLRNAITINAIKPNFLCSSSDPYLYLNFNVTGIITMYETVNPINY